MTETNKANIVGIDKGDGMDDIPVETKRERKTPVHKHVTSLDATTGVAVWTPTTGKKFVITDLKISVASATSVTLDDGGTNIEKYHLAANGGVVSNQQTQIKSAATDNILGVITGSAVNIAVTVDGYEL